MQVRMKDKPDESFYSGKFNIHAFGEVIGFGDAFGSDLFFIEDLDVFIEAGSIDWKDMRQAFKDKDLITGNYNTRFFEPANKEDRERGFTLN